MLLDCWKLADLRAQVINKLIIVVATYTSEKSVRMVRYPDILDKFGYNYYITRHILSVFRVPFSFFYKIYHEIKHNYKACNFEKIVMPPICYVFNGIHFRFRLCVTEIPADLRLPHCM